MNKQQLIEIENILSPGYDTRNLTIGDLRSAVKIDLDRRNYPKNRKRNYESIMEWIHETIPKPPSIPPQKIKPEMLPETEKWLNEYKEKKQKLEEEIKRLEEEKEALKEDLDRRNSRLQRWNNKINNFQNIFEPIVKRKEERRARFNEALNSMKMTNINDIAEVERRIKVSKNKIIDSLSDDCIMFFEPKDGTKFNRTLHRARQSFEQTLTREETEARSGKIYQTYYNNVIKSVQDIYDFIDSIKEPRPFKISIDYGSIYEEIEEDVPKYHPAFPALDDTMRHIPMVIRDDEDLSKFKEYANSLLIEYKEYLYESTKKHLCAVFSTLIAVYRLSFAGGRVSSQAPAALREHIRSHLVSYIHCQYNICVWLALSKLLAPELKGNQRIAHAKALICNTLNLHLNQNELTKWLLNYKGFNFATDTEITMEKNNVSFHIIEYDSERKVYYISNEYMKEDAKHNLYVLLVPLSDTETHALYVSDPEKLLNVKICPICNSFCISFDRKNCNTQRNLKRFQKHVDNCNGKLQKTLKLDKESKPYVPHILNNKTFEFLLANDRIEEFKPTEYYMTYDFETMEDKSFTYNTEQTEIKSSLVPLSVASTVKLPNTTKTIYYDVRDGEDFIIKWIQSLFVNAQAIIDANSYQDKDIPFDDTVTVLGYNSARFDINLFIDKLQIPDKWRVISYLGSSNSCKQVIIQKGDIKLRFIDAMAFVTPQPLKEFVKSFGANTEENPSGSEPRSGENKGLFPYEAFNASNYKEVLNKSEPFTYEDFYSDLNNSNISAEEYNIYLNDYKNFKNRWEYLRHYNILDTKIMINPIDNLIDNFFTYGIDMLHNISLASNASSTKYALAYEDFDIHEDYNLPTNAKPFVLTKSYWQHKVENYKWQDEHATKPRDTTNNVKDEDFEYFKKLFSESKCYICNAKFTVLNKPTLDRIDNKVGHTKENVRPCCAYCNVVKSNKDENITRLRIQLRNYALLKNLPMTITNDEVYHKLRDSITGGLSNVQHRYNIKGETHINHFKYESGTMISYDTEHIMTHFCGVDFNSLYPSSFSSVPNPNNPYTNHIMYMPGRVEGVFKDKDICRSIINRRNILFLATIKGHIDERYINEFINFAPIFRNIDILTNKEMIGEYMFDHMEKHELPRNKKERKLTQLLSTHGEFMNFTSYYLWFLIDRCHFIVDDIESVITFTAHKAFNNFVETFMNERIKSLEAKNKGKELFCKISLNGSYGYDGMNTEKYSKVKLCDKRKAQLKQLYDNFISTRELNEDLYAVNMNPKTFKCNTCLQEAVFTLDNAKFWYLNFIYNFMYKCLDMDKIHFIEGDTDSSYWAISGNPNEDYHQRFKYVIKDQEFYDKHFYEWFPNPDKGVKDEKKLLGLAIEKEGENMIALSPKCYTTFNGEQTITTKMKGCSKKRNSFTKDSYADCVNDGTITKGTNANLQVKRNKVCKLFMNKNALTGVHTKAVVLPNQSCAPFIYNLNADKYI